MFEPPTIGSGALGRDTHGAGLPDALETATVASLSVVLHRVKSELDTLAVMVGDMQNGLTPLLGGRVSDDPDACRHAQNLDRVWQMLESLSQVLNAVAREGASHHPIDIDAIALRLPLSDLSARLRGVDPIVNGSGDDLDLF
jgi:hypothetical protein